MYYNQRSNHIIKILRGYCRYFLNFDNKILSYIQCLSQNCIPIDGIFSDFWYGYYNFYGTYGIYNLLIYLNLGISLEYEENCSIYCDENEIFEDIYVVKTKKYNSRNYRTNLSMFRSTLNVCASWLSKNQHIDRRNLFGTMEGLFISKNKQKHSLHIPNDQKLSLQLPNDMSAIVNDYIGYDLCQIACIILTVLLDGKENNSNDISSLETRIIKKYSIV